MNSRHSISFILLSPETLSTVFALTSECVSNGGDLHIYLYSAPDGVSKTEALSVHFRSSKKVRLKAKETRKEEQIEYTSENEEEGDSRVTDQ